VSSISNPMFAPSRGPHCLCRSRGAVDRNDMARSRDKGDAAYLPGPISRVIEPTCAVGLRIRDRARRTGMSNDSPPWTTIDSLLTMTVAS